MNHKTLINFWMRVTGEKCGMYTFFGLLEGWMYFIHYSSFQVLYTLL